MIQPLIINQRCKLKERYSIEYAVLYQWQDSALVIHAEKGLFTIGIDLGGGSK